MAKNEEAKKAAKVVDPEQAKKSDAKKAARKAARERIVKFLADNADQLGGLVDDVKLFIGSGKAPGAGLKRSSVNSELREALLSSGDKGLTEMDIFKAFRIGRPEMVTKIRVLVLCPNPADRVWVRFDEASEVYKVVGKGANPPKSWDGYVPATKESL
jgi:hypothetical protein